MHKDDTQRTVERIARESYGRLVALLALRTRDVATAEDLLAEAFASALEQWPVQGVPANPDGWLQIIGVVDDARNDDRVHRAVVSVWDRSIQDQIRPHD